MRERSEVDHKDPSDALRLLTDGQVESCEHIAWGSNYIFCLVLALEGAHALAVYKPRRGERPLWDFPTGTLYCREYAAFVTSQALEWPFIPTTVIRDGPLGVGSVQFYVDAQPLPSLRDLHALEDLDLARIAAFDIITNNADRKAGHVLRDADGRLWGIDHGLCFNVAPKVRTVLLHYCGKPLPEPILGELQAFRASSTRAKGLEENLRQIIADDEVEALWQRLDWLIGNGTYPHLDPHRSVPWPLF